MRCWLAGHPEDRKGSKGAIRKSNRTDNESAKMATSKGVMQGYTGVAAVDAKHQIIVEAQTHGTGSEQKLPIPVVKAMEDTLADDTLITADAGYHSESNLRRLGFAEECRRQSHFAAQAGSTDTDMQQFMDEALADVDGWTE